MTETAGALGPSLDLVGMVTHYVAGEQAGEQVRQFVVTSDQGLPVPVELRGQTVSGVIAEGDQVALVVPWNIDKREDRTQYPLKLKNLSTGGVVSVMRPGLRKKALGAGLASVKEIWKAMLGGLAAAALILIGVSNDQAAAPVGPTDNGPGIATLVVLELLWVAVSAIVFYVRSYRRWSWEGGALPIWKFLNLTIVGGFLIAGIWSIA